MNKIHYFTALFFLQFFVISSVFSQVDEQLEARIQQAISQMSLKEKVGQTCQITLDALLKTDASGKVLEPAQLDEVKLQEALVDFQIGSILNVSSHTLQLKEWQTILGQIHQFYKSKKVKTPILYGADAIHGMNYTVGATLFPQEIGLAATWNPALAEQFGKITAYELRASGIPWNFSPVMDLGRQPLWSRFFETMGEDPYLSSSLGKRIIAGYQGSNLNSPYSTVSCLKHFVGYSFPLTGRDRTPAWIPEKYMQELFLPPFEATVKAGALSVMVNSGEVNGIPGHINYHLLTEVLKGEWDFQGFAVSDWEDILMLESVHRTASNHKEAIIQALNAGLDMSMVPLSPQYKEYCRLLLDAMNEKRISENRLNDAVARILRVKMKLGLYEKQVFEAKNYPLFGSIQHKNAAKEAALESITLLKNNSILPLKKGTAVLVAGPTSDNLIYLNGAWTHTWQGMDSSYNTKGCKTIAQAIQALNGPATKFAKGAQLSLKEGWEQCELVESTDYKNKLAQCDVVVLCLGELPATEKPGDIRSLDLPAAQLALAEAAFAAKKPVVLVLLEGRPRIIRSIVDQSAAIVQAYLPGDYGAEAIADILFGACNPSGKLPYAYPKYNGVIEHYDLKRSEARSGKTNQFDAYDPEWDFGFGLSYTTFAYSNLKISKNELKQNDSIQVSVSVTNIGKMDGKEVVQLYLTDDIASSTTFGKRLKGFEKIALKAGETKTVNFVISEKDLMFANFTNKMVTESGSFTIKINELTTNFNYSK